MCVYNAYLLHDPYKVDINNNSCHTCSYHDRGTNTFTPAHFGHTSYTYARSRSKYQLANYTRTYYQLKTRTITHYRYTSRSCVRDYKVWTMLLCVCIRPRTLHNCMSSNALAQLQHKYVQLPKLHLLSLICKRFLFTLLNNILLNDDFQILLVNFLSCHQL